MKQMDELYKRKLKKLLSFQHSTGINGHARFKKVRHMYVSKAYMCSSSLITVKFLAVRYKTKRKTRSFPKTKMYWQQFISNFRQKLYQHHEPLLRATILLVKNSSCAKRQRKQHAPPKFTAAGPSPPPSSVAKRLFTGRRYRRKRQPQCQYAHAITTQCSSTCRANGSNMPRELLYKPKPCFSQAVFFYLRCM